MVVTNCTITGNIASFRAANVGNWARGAGIYNGNGSLTINNSIVAYNYVNSTTNMEDIRRAGGTITGSNNLIGTPINGTHSITSSLIGTTSTKPLTYDPGFLKMPSVINSGSTGWEGYDAANWDLRLQSNSRAINAGSNSLAVVAGLTTSIDVAGNSRFVGIIDMGAYERQPQPQPSPVAPANFRSTTQTATSVTLAWTLQTNLRAYTIQYKTLTSSTWQTWTGTLGLTATSATITGLAANTTYDFRLTATNSGGLATSTTRATTPVPIPDPIGETIATAYPITFTNNAYSTTQKIGDGIYGTKDVDMYAITVTAVDVGRKFTFGTSLPPGGTSVDTYIKLFDATGTPLPGISYNDDINYPTNPYSYLEYTFTAAGTYYLGVSSYGNRSYNPTVAGSGPGGTIGDYVLTVNRIISDNVGDTLPTARPITFVNDTYSFMDAIGGGTYGNKDVDMYRLDVAASDVGRIYTFGTSLPSGGTSVDTYIKLFDASGSPLPGISYNDDINFSNLYSYLEYAFITAGTYYLGVSSYGNRTYNPTTAGSGPGGTTGDYTLTVNRLPVPPNLRSTTPTANSVTLQWNSQTGLIAYKLEYKTATSSWQTWTPAPETNAASATIPGLEANTAYDFRLTATNTHGSALSTTSATTDRIKLGVTTFGNVVATSSDMISVEWGAVTNASGYVVEYKKDGEEGWTDANVTLTGTAATITGLEANTVYHVRVMVLGTGDYRDSDWSVAVSVPTPPKPILVSLDLDGDGVVNERDANLLLLYAFGFHEGNSGWANNLLRNSTGTRNTGAQVLDYLNTHKNIFDLDGDGVVDERDANMLLLYTFGFHEGNSAWANNLLRNSTGTRNTGSQVLAYIQSVLPTSGMTSAMPVATAMESATVTLPTVSAPLAASFDELFTDSYGVDLSMNTIAGIDLLDGQKRMESREQELLNGTVSNDLSNVFADYENWIYEESDDQAEWNSDFVTDRTRLTALDLVLSGKV